MTVKASQKAATKRYEDKNYDKILLRLKKTDITSKENILAHAEKVGESINGYIQKAVENRILSDDAKEDESNE